MCGIVGYVGNRPAQQPLLAGLERLEHRGYDSAGMATLCRGQFQLRRQVGRVNRLAQLLAGNPAAGMMGIAHTRWATHGEISQRNAHPHVDASRKIALVHNGIIENHETLRRRLKRQGIVLDSQTDSEALVQLIGLFYRQTGDFSASLRQALRDVQGTFGLAVLCADCPQTLWAARRSSPLVVGRGTEEFFVASDASPLVGQASEVVYLDEDETVRLGPEGMRVMTLEGGPVPKTFSTLRLEAEQIELGRFTHYMHKEIHQQPESLRDVMRGRLNRRSGRPVLGGLAACRPELSGCRNVLLFGCGTAWHAALIGRSLFEELAQISAETETAGELRFRNPRVGRRTLAIAVSQSGETADTLGALGQIKARGAITLGVVNVVGSSLARETDAGVYLHVGPEISVASTKAFTAQVAALAMLAIWLADERGRRDSPLLGALVDELLQIPDKLQRVLELEPGIRELAQRLADWDHWLYLGRGISHPVALEGALKLKETSYIHAEGFPAAEMKHGPMALIEAGMPVVVVVPRDRTYAKMLATIEEVKSRGAQVIAVADKNDRQLRRLADHLFVVPKTLPLLSPLLTVVPLQLLAYHAALARGCDVDKPRHLAKCVTVE